MTRFRALSTAFLVALAGCAASSGQFVRLPPIVCVATYKQLPDGSEIGSDGCGNAWLKVDGDCYLLDDSLKAFIPIECPAQGDTLAIVEIQEAR